MTRRRSRILFIFLSLILVVSLFFSFVSFTLPNEIKGNHYEYTSFLSNIRLGHDIGKGVSITYRAKSNTEDDYTAKRDRTVEVLTSILKSKGYYDIASSDYYNSDSDRGFRLDIGNTLNKTEIDEIETIIGNPSSIGFSSNFNTSGIFAGSEVVNYVTIVSGNNDDGVLTYYVLVVFTKDGLEVMKNNSSTGIISLHLGDRTQSYYGSSNITDDRPYYVAKDTTSTSEAVSVATELMVASLPLGLTKIDFRVTPATFGNNATLVVGIVLIAVTLAVFVYYIVRFGQLGWLACYNFLFFIVLGLFFLQAIPAVHVNLAGIFGILIAMWLVGSSTIRQYSRANKLYSEGMKLFVAIKSAENETMLKTLIIHAVVIAVGFVTMLFPTAILHSFGWTAFVLAIVSLFITLAMSRLLNRMYLPFNSQDGKKCHFKKGGKNE